MWYLQYVGTGDTTILLLAIDIWAQVVFIFSITIMSNLFLNISKT